MSDLKPLSHKEAILRINKLCGLLEDEREETRKIKILVIKLLKELIRADGIIYDLRNWMAHDEDIPLGYDGNIDEKVIEETKVKFNVK